MLTVVIPTHGRPDLLRRTLESFIKCELPDSYHELVVVENGSRDGAEEVVAALPARLHANYLHISQGNKSAALNTVLDEIRDSWCLFFDDDVRIAGNVLSAYANACCGSSGGQYFGGPVAPDYEEAPEPWLNLPASASGWSLECANGESTSRRFLGCNWAAYSEDLRRLGGFNSNFGPGSPSGSRGQEHEMQMRMHEAGLVGIYLSEAMVYHFVPKDRCSVRWSLQRAFENGVHSGQRARRRDKAPMLFGFPRWKLRTLTEQSARLLWQSVVGDKESRYRSRFAVQQELGFLKGWKTPNSENQMTSYSGDVVQNDLKSQKNDAVAK